MVNFPGAGEVIETQPSQAGYNQYANSLGTEENIPTEWAPFSTRREWEVACWAKLRGSKFHRIVGVVGDRWCESIRLIYSTGTEGLVSQLPEALGLSFSSSEDLNKIIDKKLPNGLPQFI